MLDEERQGLHEAQGKVHTSSQAQLLEPRVLLNGHAPAQVC